MHVAGGSYPFADVGARSGVVDWSSQRQPDVVVLMPCGFPIAQTMRELDWLRQRPEWRGLHAVRTGRASVVDGNAYFNRPGPRLVESAEILAALLHPDECGDRMVAGAALLLASRKKKTKGSTGHGCAFSGRRSHALPSGLRTLLEKHKAFQVVGEAEDGAAA